MAGGEIAQHLSGEPQPARLLVQTRRPLDLAGDVRLIVILHVAPDTAQFVMHRDAGALEMVGIADAGKLQDMRRADRTGGQDHLARDIDTLRGAVARILDTHRAVPSNSTRCTSAPVTIWRFGRFSAGRR